MAEWIIVVLLLLIWAKLPSRDYGAALSLIEQELRETKALLTAMQGSVAMMETHTEGLWERFLDDSDPHSQP